MQSTKQMLLWLHSTHATLLPGVSQQLDEGDSRLLLFVLWVASEIRLHLTTPFRNMDVY